jgi:hypothetical protein
MNGRETDGDVVAPWAEADTAGELRDDADDFEDALIAEMRGRGVIGALYGATWPTPPPGDSHCSGSARACG